MFPDIKTGFINGTGAAKNVSIGFVPTFVKLINLTDGTKIFEGAVAEVMTFTSGSLEVKKGDTIKGVTSGATAVIRQVILDTGSWAGGDAAGWLILETRNGTFGSENAYISSDDTAGTNDLTVAAAAVLGVDIDTEVAGTTGAIIPYTGSDTPGSEAARGFTISSGASTDAKLLFYVAMRDSGN